MRLADNNLVPRDSKKKYQRRRLARTTWLIIDLKVVLGELLGPAKRAQKTVRVLTRARVLCVKSTENRCFGKCSFKPMILATFQAFEVFRTFLTILRLFDNIDESTTVSSALPPLSTTSSISSSFGAKSDDVVVFNIGVSSAAIHLKPWMKY